MAKNKRKRKAPPRKRPEKPEERPPVEGAAAAKPAKPSTFSNPESRPESRLRVLWRELFGRRLFRAKDPEDDVAAAHRMIEETCSRAQTAFRRALQRIEREEAARPRPSRTLPALARADAVIVKMDREVRALRASARSVRSEARAPAAWRPEAARETLEQLGENLQRLAEARDVEAAHGAEWERRAMMAVEAENDELALEALSRKREHDRAHRLFAREHAHGKEVVGLLRELFDAAERARGDGASTGARGPKG